MLPNLEQPTAAAPLPFHLSSSSSLYCHHLPAIKYNWRFAKAIWSNILNLLRPARRRQIRSDANATKLEPTRRSHWRRQHTNQIG